VGDGINLMMAATAYNFKKLMRQLLYYLFLFYQVIKVRVIASIPVRIAL
jgi:hypothetical protein